MLDRSSKSPTYPVKNQETSITYGGKTYAICSDQQIDYIKLQARDQVMFDAFEKQIEMTEEEINKKVQLVVENCGYATLDYVLGLMTPQEREDWKVRYRFTPITRPAR